MKLTEAEKIAVLEEAVLYRTAEETAEIYRRLGEVKFTARALGFACHYRGLDAVRVLVDGGADFSGGFFGYSQNISQFDHVPPAPYTAHELYYETALFEWDGFLEKSGFYQRGKDANLKALPPDERLKIYEYLAEDIENIGKVKFRKNYFFRDIFTRDIVFLPHFREFKSDKLVEIARSGDNHKWRLFYFYVEELPYTEKIPCISMAVSKLGGKKLRYRSECRSALRLSLRLPGLFEFIAKSYRVSKQNRKELLETLIETDMLDDLNTAEKYGWLDDPQVINALIGFSADNKKNECTAWLLTLKNRKFDFNALREGFDKALTLGGDDDDNGDGDSQ